MKVSQVTTGLAVASLALAFAANPAHAGTIVALPGSDGGAGGGGCSLREAIDAANADSVTGTDCTFGATVPGADEILLMTTPATYEMTRANPGGASDDTNVNGDFDVTDTDGLTITGAGADVSTIDANTLDRVFDVIGISTELTLRDLTVTGGKAPNGTAGSPGAKGGGIRAAGTLTLDGVVVTANTAGNGGAGTNGTPGQAGGQGGDGGGVFSSSFVTVTDTVISNNFAGNGGSGGSASGACSSATTGGTGGAGGFGGGIAADNGGATISGSTITGNLAGLGGAGGCAATPGMGGNGGVGGGILASVLTLTNSTVSNNQTRPGGQSGLDGDSPNTTASGQGGDGGGIFAYTQAAIAGSTISGNVTGAGGGNGPGTGGTGPGAEGGDGGGAVLQISGSVTNSTFSSNHTGNGGTSTTTFANRGGNGGGLVFPDPDFPPNGYAISKSTFTGNFTGSGGNSPTQPGDGGAGGAIFAGNAGGVRTLAISDSTLTGNFTGSGGDHTAGGTGGAGGRGGAIGVGDFATVGLTHLTIAANTSGSGGTGGTLGAQSDGGAIGVSSGVTPSTVTVTNSILASNLPATCAVSNATLTDGGHNLVFGTQCTDITAFSTADPLLAALADNGGATQTRAIGDASPARDAVPATGAGCTAADQRGTTRPQGTACDAGAYEIFVPPPDTGGGTPGDTPPADTPPADTPPATTQPPTGITQDVTKPRITLRIPRQTLRRIIRRGFACTFFTNEAGRATARFGRFRTIRFTVRTAGKQRCVIRLSRRTKRRLARLRTLKVTVTVSVRDAAGNVGRASKRLTLKR